MLIIGAAVGVGIVGSIGGLFIKRRSRSSLELVNVKGSSKISTPVISQKMGGSSGSSSTPSPVASFSGPSVELHPAVAALKQEMSERRMSLGMNPGMMDQGQGPANSPHQNTPSSVASMLPPDIRALAQAPRMPPPSPSSPQQSPPMLQTVQPPPLPRPPMQMMPPVRPGQPTMPMMRQGPPNAPIPRPVQPNVPAARPTPPPTVIPQNVTTVITGIMPRKKDPNDPDDKKSSGQ
jgi:hypothetical protein